MGNSVHFAVLQRASPERDAFGEPAVANDGGKNRQLRHASLAGLGVGVASTGIAKIAIDKRVYAPT